MKRGDHYDHIVLQSFDSQLHSDAIFSHLVSIMAMRNVHNMVGEVLWKCTDSPEFDGVLALDKVITDVAEE
jgi:hypothetical protein